jgi:hypothetical protein
VDASLSGFAWLPPPQPAARATVMNTTTADVRIAQDGSQACQTIRTNKSRPFS